MSKSPPATCSFDEILQGSKFKRSYTEEFYHEFVKVDPQSVEALRSHVVGTNAFLVGWQGVGVPYHFEPTEIFHLETS